MGHKETECPRKAGCPDVLTSVPGPECLATILQKPYTFWKMMKEHIRNRRGVPHDMSNPDSRDSRIQLIQDFINILLECFYIGIDKDRLQDKLNYRRNRSRPCQHGDNHLRSFWQAQGRHDQKIRAGP